MSSECWYFINLVSSKHDNDQLLNSTKWYLWIIRVKFITTIITIVNIIISIIVIVILHS